MKKSLKILASSFVLLLMLSNISFAFTYSICEMTMKSSCKCTMAEDDRNNNVGDLNIHPKSCCNTEIKFINNSSDFENNTKVTFNNISGITALYNLNLLADNRPADINRKEILVFYADPNGLSVKYSSLII